MRRLRHLTGQHRTLGTNRLLGALLAFNAGAINAGGFLVVGMYTSHMTGFASMLADSLVLGHMRLVLGALGAMLAFVLGAAATALLVNWARQRRLRSEYALPLLAEALLMLVFGLLGATLGRETPFAVPMTVLVLAFTMGLQNALVTKISASQIRTTHMTGVITDLGIELGKLVYWNGRPRAGAVADAGPQSQVRANRVKMRLYASLLLSFMGGGVVGAMGFKYVGFIWVLPLAALLLMVSLPPLLADLRKPARRSRIAPTVP
ncbi:MAG: hypothetical protein CFE43_16235 [Burkholderiales bacterium PBB3]|nr:MAG: hypothetical protein CFE43_16235 [Burkholderiales bacterium PBB3]